MTDDKLIDLWSEDDLDRALDALHADAVTDPATLAATRTNFFQTIGQSEEPVMQKPVRRKRRWAYPLAAAASIAALVTTGFLVTANSPGGNAAAADLGAAADHITSTDPVIPPGQYRKVTQHSWAEVGTELVNGGWASYLEETVTETWIPAQRTDEWVQRNVVTGKKKWLQGSEADLGKLPPANNRPTIVRAKCGDFTRDEGKPATCATNGDWGSPTPDWIAGLPRDPKALYERLRKDSPRNSRGETELLVYANDALATNLLPADLRAALYRALGYLDDLEVTDRAANLDGRKGISYGSDDGTTREEIIIDPATGEFIGDRQVATSGKNRGTVYSFTSVTNAISSTAP
jgi:hypothetical protein